MKVIQSVSGLMSATKGQDLNIFIEGLTGIQEGFSGASNVMEATMMTTLPHAPKRTGLHDQYRKRDWHSVLRDADTLIRGGDLATFKELACKMTCQLDPAFQWSVCQRLGEIVANPMSDTDII